MSKKSGFILGALVGAAAAVLLAPKKGSDLRQDVGQTYDDFKDDPKGTLNNLVDTAADFYNEKSSQVIEFSTDKFNDIKEKFDNGEISAETAKDFLLTKSALIKEKVDSGELSKEKVMDFFNSTKEAIVTRVNEQKANPSELFDEYEDESIVEPVEKAEEVVAEVVESSDVDLDLEKLTEKADEIANKAKELAPDL